METAALDFYRDIFVAKLCVSIKGASDQVVSGCPEARINQKLHSVNRPWYGFLHEISKQTFTCPFTRGDQRLANEAPLSDLG